MADMSPRARLSLPKIILKSYEKQWFVLKGFTVFLVGLNMKSKCFNSFVSSRSIESSSNLWVLTRTGSGALMGCSCCLTLV